MISAESRPSRCAGALTVLLIVLAFSSAAAQTPRAPYLQRGDDVEQRYKTHRERLQQFFAVLSAQLEKDVPDLRQKLIPPAPVPFGYQTLPNIFSDPPARPQSSRIVLSPFSWPRTDSIISRGSDSLGVLEIRFDSIARLDSVNRVRAYSQIVDSYKKLVDAQKFMESLIQYNRLWQSEIAGLTENYKKNNEMRDAALSRQALIDSIAHADDQFKQSAQPRVSELSRRLNAVLQKAPTPAFVHVAHPAEHTWILSVPVYTDIIDSSFVSHAQEVIENGWHVRDGDDDFSVKLEIRRISPSALYANEIVPPNGEHINVGAHVKRFPQDGVALTTGANTTYVLGQSIVLGPQAIPRKTVVHEFGHMLGFRDGYFRSYYDLGENGFNVVEVILDPNDVITTPESGKATRRHFEQILRERSALH